MTPCPACGKPSLTQLRTGDVCADCASAAAWKTLGSQGPLVIDRADIEASVRRHRGETPRLWRRLPWASLLTAGGGAFSIWLLLAFWSPRAIGPLSDLLDDLALTSGRAGAAGLLTFVFGVAALIAGRRRFRARPILAAHLLGVIAGATAGLGGGLPWLSTRAQPYSHVDMPALELPSTSEVARKILAATAVILAPDEDGDARFLALGSGAVIARDPDRAWIITCSHVAMPYADVGARRDPRHAHPVWVQLSDGRQALGKVRWAAPPPLDVALVELPIADAPEPVPIAADAALLREDAAVSFAPNPYRDGWLWHRGKILSRKAHDTPAGRYELFYTDLPVVPGDSGSGLYDERGRLIGLNTWARRSGDTSQGISLPSETMRAVVEALDGDQLEQLDPLAPIPSLAPSPSRR
jgi:S1-C subfamily serine protease